MKATILIWLLTGFVPLFAQNTPDSTAWYFPWVQRMEQTNSMQEYQTMRKEFEEKYRNRPLALLRLYALYEENLSKAYVRSIKSARSDKERREITEKYEFSSGDRWKDFVLTVADVASKIDTIPDVRLSNFARMMKESAERIRFYRRLRTVGAPDFQFTDLQGRVRHFSEFKDLFVLLFFWNRHSVPCMEELPYLKKAQQIYAGKLQVIGVYVSFLQDPMEKEIVQNLIKEMGLNWVHIFGPQSNALKKRFFILTFPTNLVFNPRGKLLNEPLDRRGELQSEKLLSTLKRYLNEQE